MTRVAGYMSSVAGGGDMGGHLEIPDGWTPDFPGQRPPFTPGNQLAVTHGAYSKERTDPIARRYLAEIADDPSLEYLNQPRFHAGLWLWASAMAKVELLSAWVDDQDIADAADSDRGKTSALELLRKWMATAQTWASRLGLDPLSAARLGKDVAQGRAADAATTLTALRAQHEAATRTQAVGGSTPREQAFEQ